MKGGRVMNMADVLQVGKNASVPQCYNCDWSFRVQPTYRETKLGIALLVYYCAHKVAQRTMSNGDVLPMRCDDMRGGPKLCGKEGRYWKEYKETPLFSFELRGVRTGRVSTTVSNESNTSRPSSGSNTTMSGPIIREPGVMKRIEVPGTLSKAPRKPYEIKQ